MKKLILLAVSLTVLSFGMQLMPSLVGASAVDDIRGGVTAGDTGSPSINSAIGAGVNILSILIGVFSVVMVLMGGYKYIASGGDANKVAAAKHTVLYALIGLAVAVLSQTILRFVIAKANTGVSGGGAVTAPTGGGGGGVVIPPP